MQSLSFNEDAVPGTPALSSIPVSAMNEAECYCSAGDGLRLRSAYTLSNGTRTWITTEADRTATTVLLASEC
jgi:hypothetical protein